MMTIIEGLRQIVGTPNFYQVVDGVQVWQYDAMFEYFFGCLILCIVVSSVFRMVVARFK